ncbi:MAG: hypothetical protein MHM6MM_008065, partial [Cercozoa sp. M6MM]
IKYTEEEARQLIDAHPYPAARSVAIMRDATSTRSEFRDRERLFQALLITLLCFPLLPVVVGFAFMLLGILLYFCAYACNICAVRSGADDD